MKNSPVSCHMAEPNESSFQIADGRPNVSVVISDWPSRVALGSLRGLTLGRSARLNVSLHVLLWQDTTDHGTHAGKTLATATLFQYKESHMQTEGFPVRKGEFKNISI